MMRMTALVFVCSSFVVGCSWGEGSGSDDPTPDAAGTGGAVCGDGVCAANEVASCSADCGSGGGGGGGGNAVCGNNTCETGESPTSCPNDCTSGGGGGSGSGSGSGTCSPPVSDITECAACIIPGSGTCPGGDLNGCIACAAGGLGGGGLPGANCNNDGVCDQGEDASCVLDMCP